MFKKIAICFAVVSGVCGLGCLIAPVFMISSYGIALSEMGYVIYRFWGAMLLGLALITWLFRNLHTVDLQKRLAIALGVTSFLGTFAAVLGQFKGANNIGWSTVGIFAIFGVLFSIFVIRKVKDK